MNTSETNNRELQIFGEAISIASIQERLEFVRQACDSDADLFGRVQALLQAHDRTTAFLPEYTAKGPITPVLTEKPGDRIGRYKLLEKIGVGGFGVVYMAEQEEPVRRRVALKVIKLGMDTEQVVARFEAERQALAMMDHPNIAKVFDAGATESGRPYFVMELVRGAPITEFCDKNRATARERLELLIPICHAIEHAHQKGIVHRDLKPSNVLVTLHNGKPLPMVIDFGVAKAINQRLTEKTVFTQFATMIGTPAYMSPEQAEMSRMDVDTRSDIYSLGVLLYELLTGSTPFPESQLRSAGYGEMQRIIVEQEPESPSTRVSTLAEQERTMIAKKRSSDPRSLGTLIRGDLDWIVLKCLEKDRNRRYETPNALARDIRRHLDNEPILARPATPWERAVKWAKRRPALAAISGVVAAATLACAFLGIYASRQAVLASRHAKEAERATRTAEASARQEAFERQRAEQALLSANRASYQASIHAADALLKIDDIGEAQRKLESCIPELRGWEWNHLKLKADSSALTIEARSSLNWFAEGAVSLSPDGKWIASVNQSSISLWSSDTGELKWLTNAPPESRCVVFSPDGRLLAAGGAARDGTPENIMIWKTDTRESIAKLALDGGGVTSLAFDNKGRSLLIGSGEWELLSSPSGAESGSLDGKGKVRVLNLASNAIQLLGEHLGPVEFVRASPDDTKIVSWSRRRGTETKVWKFPPERTPEAATQAFNPPRQKLLFAEQEPEDGATKLHLAVHPRTRQVLELRSSASGMEIVDVFERTVLHRLPVPWDKRKVTSWAIHPDATQIVAAIGNTLQVWDTIRAELVGAHRGHLKPVFHTSFSPDGTCVVSSDGEQVKVWDLLRTPPLRVLKSPNHRNWALSSTTFSPEPGAIFVANSGGWIRGLEIATGLLTWETGIQLGITPHISDLKFSSDGKFLAVAGDDIGVWDFPARKLLETLPSNVHDRSRISWNPGAPELLWFSYNILQLRDFGTGVTRSNTFSSNIAAASFSPDGGTIMVGFFSENGLKILDAKSLRPLSILGPDHAVNLAAYDPTGRLIATVASNEILLWDSPSGELKARAKSEVGVRSLAFTPEGSRLMTGGYNGTVRLWDPSDLQLLLTLGEPSHKAVRSLSFNEDGTQLASVAGDVLVWTAASRPPKQTPAQRVALKLRGEVAKLLDRLFYDHFLVTNVVEQLAKDPNLDPLLKAEAIRFALQRDEGHAARDLAARSYVATSDPNGSRDSYQRALRMAEAACRIERNGDSALALGRAHFRLGQFQEALTALTEASRLTELERTRATAHLFSAMAHQKLGNHDMARKLLDQAKGHHLEGWSDGPPREAEELIQNKP